ncbi:hypothetical protein EAF04_009784 [Stromatinia cepivora]|nr:hypothetical protein EAF04_009784 [Stromatinia cepivora]
MSSPEEIKDSFAREVNILREIYGFETLIYFTSMSREGLILCLATHKHKGGAIVANIRGCPVFKNRVDVPGRLESGAGLSSRAMAWFGVCNGNILGLVTYGIHTDEDNRATFPMTYEEEKQYIELKAKMQSIPSQYHQFADKCEASINKEVKFRDYFASQDQPGVDVSGTKPDARMSNDAAQLQSETTCSNNRRGTKRTRDEDAEISDIDVGVEVPRKLSKQARNRAAKRAKTLATIADSSFLCARKSP